MVTAKSSHEKDQYFSRAVSRALEALEILQVRLHLSKTSTFRLLRTLEASGCSIAGEWGEYSLAVLGTTADRIAADLRGE